MSSPGARGNDNLVGGTGDDHAQRQMAATTPSKVERANDVLTGGEGNDNLDGGSGDDTLKRQWRGNDRLTGRRRALISSTPGAGDDYVRS